MEGAAAVPLQGVNSRRTPAMQDPGVGQMKAPVQMLAIRRVRSSARPAITAKGLLRNSQQWPR